MQVSHDQYLIEATVDELWMCEGGSVSPWRGTFQEYKVCYDEVHRRVSLCPVANTAAKLLVPSLWLAARLLTVFRCATLFLTRSNG
jgi:hypothetical protein